MSAGRNNKTHPANTELIIIREVEIDVAGNPILVAVDVPVPYRVVCEQCGAEVAWCKGEDEDGTVVVEIVGPTCGCMA